MMKAIAAYILRGPLQAVVATIGFALLALIIPPAWPLSYLSGAAVVLVFLSQGAQQGIQTALLASLGLGLITLLLLGNPVLAMTFAVMTWLPALILAYALQRTASMANTLLLATAIGLGLEVAVYVLLGDPAGLWLSHINETLIPQLMQAGVELPDEAVLKASFEIISKWVTGVLISMWVFGHFSTMLIARWWQSVLYKPGGFSEEFHQLRFGTVAAALTVGMIVLALVSAGKQAEVVTNLLLLLIMLFMFQGLAVVHALVTLLKMSRAWLVMVYIVIIFAMPYGGLLFAAVGLMDNWFNFRGRFSGQAK